MKDNCILTAESVTEGHPDKLCDTIADAVVDACLTQDAAARVACEVMATAGKIIAAGEITAAKIPDIPAIICRTVREAGYGGSDYEVEDITHEQSPDIAEAVCGGTETGAGDQGILYGFACDETKELLPLLLDHQARHKQAELDSRQCLSGPHKDDLLVDINGLSAKTYGSQGQTRTAALSLKLAQREIFQAETEEWPVLLLADVLSELDSRRQAFILNRIRGGQVFITCCEEEKLEGLEGGKAFHVQGGSLI